MQIRRRSTLGVAASLAGKVQIRNDGQTGGVGHSPHLTEFPVLSRAGARLAPSEGEVTFSGVFVETDDTTGLAQRIEPLRQGGRLAPIFPAVGL